MISSKQIVINGQLINYYQNETKKTAPAVVFLHGWRSEANAWRKILQILDQQNVKFFAPDLPGFGRSQMPSQTFVLDDYVNVVAEFMEQVSNKAIVVGHSFGGRIAIKLSVRRPDLVSKIVLVDSAGFVNDSEFKKSVAATMKPLFAPKFMQGLRRGIYKLIGSEDYLATPQLQRTFVNIVNEDLSEYLSRILQPTLILWGEKDKETPLSFGLRMKDLIQNSKLVVFGQVGHFPFAEKPEEFAAELNKFL